MDPALGMFLTAVGGFVGGYLGPYWAKSQEIRAIKDNFKELKRQAEATTAATKAIEAKITDDVWDRQQRWQMKRDVFFETTRKIAATKDKLTSLYSIYETDRQGLAANTPERQERRTKANTEFNDAVEGLDEAALLIDLVSEDELKRAIQEAGLFARRSADKISAGRPDLFLSSVNEFGSLLIALTRAMRKEIGEGKSPTSQSNASSAR
jgi:hypothetical protein